MTRFVLWLGAVLFVPFGPWILLDPTGLAALTERPVPTSTAMTDRRAVDGGTAVTHRVAGVQLAMTLLAGIALARDARALGGRYA